MNTMISVLQTPDCHAALECEVVLNDLEVMADIGIHAAEKGALQPLILNVSLAVVPPAADEMAQAFDYTWIREYALALAKQRINLIETFAYRLARACLESRLVMEASVEVIKPMAVPGCRAGTRVRLRKN